MGVAISKIFLVQFPFSDAALNNHKTGFVLSGLCGLDC